MLYNILPYISVDGKWRCFVTPCTGTYVWKYSVEESFECGSAKFAKVMHQISLLIFRKVLDKYAKIWCRAYHFKVS